MGEILRNAAMLAARRMLGVILFTGAFVLVTHFFPVTTTMVAPDHVAPAAPVEPPLYHDSVLDEIDSGDCWTNDGEPHGYPTRLWMLVTDEVGSYYVDSGIQTTVDAAVEGRLGKMLDTAGATYVPAAYCDGVDLTGLR